MMKLIDLTITLLNGHKYKLKQVLFYMASKRHHISQVADFRATKCKGIWEIGREHLSLSYKAESTVGGEDHQYSLSSAARANIA